MNPDSRLPELFLQYEAAHFGQAHIEDQAAGTFWLEGIQKCLPGGIALRTQTYGFDQLLDRVAHRGIVINDEYRSLFQLCHGATSRSVNWKIAPPDGYGVYQIRPPWASMIVRQMASPIPIPSPLPE